MSLILLTSEYIEIDTHVSDLTDSYMIGFLFNGLFMMLVVVTRQIRDLQNRERQYGQMRYGGYCM